MVEVAISLLIVAILSAILLPMLIAARSAAQRTVCASNLSQIGKAWQMYFNAWDSFPSDMVSADWGYGGASFGLGRTPILASSRPINQYLSTGTPEDRSRMADVYRCPSDKGIFKPDDSGKLVSMLDGQSCFETFGNSYRGNRNLLDPAIARKWTSGERPKPLRLSEVHVWENRLLLAGDAEWYYRTLPRDHPESSLSASWHGRPGLGNMLALDGSVKALVFKPGESAQYLLYSHARR